MGVVSTLGTAPDFVLCGDNPLVYHLANRLTEQFVDASVTAVVPNRDGYWLAGLEQLPRVRLLVSPRLDEQTLAAAGVAQAQAVALLDSEADVDNFRVALRVHEINPDIRLVIRMFNTGLGFRIRTLFDDCVVMSISETVAPSFVAAALGKPAPSSVQLNDRRLYVAPKDDIGPGEQVCGLREDSSGIELVAAGEPADAIVTLSEELAYSPKRRRAGLRVVRYLARNTLVRLLAGLLLTIAVCCFLFVLMSEKRWGEAIYVTLLDAAGGASLAPPGEDAAYRTLQLVVTFAGLAMTPVLTALIVGGVLWTQLPAAPSDPARYEDHVVVVGLGNVGMRIMEQLKDLGIRVVGLDCDENARGVAVAHMRGIPVVIGQATWEDSLRAAGVPKARALVLATSNDAANLETAFLGRACSETVRVVMRLSNDELAERVQRKMPWAVVRGIFQLSADGFAAAVSQCRVTATLPLQLGTLIVAEIPIEASSALAGRPLATADLPGLSRVIAVQRSVGARQVWWPDPTDTFGIGNHVLVVVTSRGLNALLGLCAGAEPR